MLKIRPEQSEVFQPVAEAAFVAEVVDYLKKTRPDEVVRLPGGPARVTELTDEILSNMVRGGIARAREYGITWCSTLVAFVVVMFVSAPNFDDHPLLKRALLDNDTDPNGRLDKLIQNSTEQNWEAARQSYDANAWGLKEREVN
ncbi:MAG: hypothetical protein MOB07_17830 [Acidobacteria bacterium]|nr:hypothetical protein [Acidobacteriota bacterium]